MSCDRGFLGAFNYAVRRNHPDPHGRDLWNMTLLLSTTFYYLYAREWFWPAVSFVTREAFDFLVYCAVTWYSKEAKRRHSLLGGVINDCVLFALTAFATWYAIEYSVFGRGRGADQVFAAKQHHVWQGWLLQVPIFFCGLPDFYWVSLATLVAFVWASFGLSVFIHHKNLHDTLYALDLALRATAVCVYYFVAFNYHIGRNSYYQSLLTIFTALFLLSTFHAISLLGD